MFKYLFARLWHNPLSRIGFIAAVLLISFALIFSERQRLQKFFARKFSSADWSDVTTHPARPFGFEENEAKARDLTETAWREVHDLAHAKLYRSEDKKEPLWATVAIRPFSAFLTRNAELQIYTFFNALATTCGDRMVSTALSDRHTALGDLAREKSAAAHLAHDLKTTLKQLMKIQALRVEAALQKKPDYLPAIELAQEIFRAGCSLREVTPLVARALDYREYYLQKTIYASDNGRLYEQNPEAFAARSREAFAGDKEYRELIRRYFEATRYRTAHDPAHLRNMRNAYAMAQNAQTLAALITALQAEARNSAPAIAKKCHAELYALDFTGITEKPEYIYALAETAMLGEDLGRAENIAANALKSGKIKDETQIRDFERLRFHLNLVRHESENISRF